MPKSVSSSLAGFGLTLCMVAGTATRSQAITDFVTSNAELVASLNRYNQGKVSVIYIRNSFSVTSKLPVISGTGSLVIRSTGSTLTGATANSHFVITGTGKVTFDDLNLVSFTTRGGDGGDGHDISEQYVGRYGGGSGGGGAGMGGAIFVGSQANVTLSNVGLTSSSAVGGNGGKIVISKSDSSGGGGGAGSVDGVGRYGSGGDGGQDYADTDPTGGKGGTGSIGGGGGGAGTNDRRGRQKAVPTQGQGGSGGYAGGNGASSLDSKGKPTVPGAGGGGGGLGGGVFVQEGGKLSISTTTTASNSVQGGVGGHFQSSPLSDSPQNGIGAGADLFLASNVTATFNSGGTSTFTGSIDSVDGTGGILVTDGSTLNLTGVSTYSGETQVGDGTLNLSKDASLINSSSVNLTSAKSILTASDSHTIQSLGGIAGSKVNLNGGSLTVGASSDTAVASLFGGTITGTGGLVKTGGSVMNLQGANTYTGGTTLNAGTLEIANNGALGSGTLTINGGSIRAAGEKRTISNQLNLNGNFNLGRVTDFTGAAVLGADITVNSSNPDTSSSATTSSFLGVISGAHSLTFAAGMNADNAVYLAANNTYSGGTTLSSGVLILGSDSAVGTGTLTLKGGELRTAGFRQLANALALEGNVTLGRDIFLSGPAVLGADTTITLANPTAAVSNPSTAVFNTVISGNHSLTFKAGTNSDRMVAFTGTNTYTGTTTLDGVTLYLGGPGTIGTGGLNLTGTGTVFDISSGSAQTLSGLTGVDGSTVRLGKNSLTVNSLDSTTFGGVITGEGGLVKQGDGTLTLTGLNTYTLQGTVIEGGVLSVTHLGDGPSGIGAAGPAAQNLLLNGGVLQYSGAGDTTQRGFTLGSEGGGLDSSGSGTIAFSNSGSVVFQSGNKVEVLTLSGTNTGNNILAAVLANNGMQESLLIKGGGGTWRLTGDNTYTGNTRIREGTLIIGDGGTHGSIQGPVSNFGTLAFDRSDTLSFAKTISGLGGVVQAGTGTLELSGANTYTGPTTIANGGLLSVSKLADGGTASGIGASTNAADRLNLNHGTLRYTGTGDTTDHRFTLAGGGGALDASGSGAIVFSNSGLIAYGTADLPTTLNLTGTSTAVNSLKAAIGDNGTGATSLIKDGSGTWSISGHNTFTGDIKIMGGKLIIASTTALGQGNVINQGGILAAGGGIHTIQVQGDFTQGAHGVLVLTTTGDNRDTLQVGGTATLGGTLVVNALNASPGSGQNLALISADGGILGNFASVLSDLPTLGVTLGSPGTVQAVQLPFAPYAQTPNQASVARYIDARDQNNVPVVVQTLVGGLNNASANPAALAGALDQLTPAKFGYFVQNTVVNNASFTTQQFDSYLEGLRTPQGFAGGSGQIDSSGLTFVGSTVDPHLAQMSNRLLAWNPAPLRRGLISDSPEMALGGIALDAPAPANPWNVFIQGNVVLGQTSSQAGLPQADSTTAGMLAGVAYQVTPNVLVGAAFGYNHTSSDLDSLGSKATLDSYAPAVFASYAKSGWYANAIGSYGINRFTENRGMSFGGFSGVAHGVAPGGQEIANLDGGYDFHMKSWTFGPTLGTQFVHNEIDAYQESGAPAGNLAVDETSSNSFRTRLGAHGSYAFRAAGLTLVPHLGASWQHEFLNQDQQINSSFVGVGPGTFAVTTPGGSRDSVLVNAGITAEVNGNLNVFVDYVAQAGQSNYFGQSVQAGIKIGF